MAKLPLFSFWLYSIILFLQFFAFLNGQFNSSKNENISVDNYLSNNEEVDKKNNSKSWANSTKNAQMLLKKGADDDENRLFVAFVFGLSFQVPDEYSYGRSNHSWSIGLFHFHLNDWYRKLPEYYFYAKHISIMTIFPNSNDTELSSECWKTDRYYELEEQMEEHYLKTEARKASDIGAAAYEPEGEFNAALMDRAEAILLSCTDPSWKYVKTVKIVYVTNFAEKKFAQRDFSGLENKIPGLRLPLILMTLNGPTYNYYFYTLKTVEPSDRVIALHLGIPKIEYIEYPERIWGERRHMIYMVALSDRLLDWGSRPIINQQFYAVNLAIKEPLERELNSYEKENIAALLLSPCFLDHKSTYFGMRPEWAEYWGELDKTTGCLMNSNKAVIRTDNIDWDKRAKKGIATMLNTAITMYDRRMGATLLADRRNDSLRPMLQKEMPTIVLVTDLFQESFVDELPDDRFLFKVYALNSTVYQRYKSIKRVDFVRLLNPNMPGEIPIRKNGPEPPNWEWDKQIGGGMPVWQIVLIIVGGIAILAFLVGIIKFKFCRKQRATGKE